MTEDKKIHLFEWILPNIFLPLVPLGLKIVICVFSNIKINILDSIELVLYNFFICIILMNFFSKKESIVGKMLYTLLVLASAVDIIIMALIYVGIENTLCKFYAIGMAIIIPIFAILYQYLQIQNEKEE